jgi:sensor histidine kinase YesM
MVAVADNGAGMDSASRKRALDTRDSREHGLQTLTQQLVLLYGNKSRIRVFSRPDHGTIACFALPAGEQAAGPNYCSQLIQEPELYRSVA